MSTGIANLSEANAEQQKTCTTRSTCRVCSSDRIETLFSLGSLYISDFVDPGQSGLRAPLELVFCEECSLVQLRHTAPQELLYSRFYWYRSGVTETMRNALRDITRAVEDRFKLRPGDIVLDIGSNDGTMLRTYTAPGIIRVGVEPATNLAEQGKVGLDYHICDFWELQSYMDLLGRKAKIITAIGMFYDMEDPNQFIADAAGALTDDGVFICQLMCLKNMLDINDIGNICHEHLEFYSFQSLEYLLNRHGLEIFDAEINDINGESYRIFAGLKDGSYKIPRGGPERVQAVRDSEQNMNDKQTFIDFYNRIEENKQKCVDFIKTEVAAGKKVWVYGASTKGNTILQHYGLDGTLITAASERSPEKWGKVTIGTNIPIVSEQDARDAQPDYFLVLPYAFIDEFYAREAEWRQKGGKFIVPLPEFRVLE